jgi:hypothetical protein
MSPQLKQNGYLYLPNFLSSQEADDIAKSFLVAKENKDFFFDRQCESSPSMYNLLSCVKKQFEIIPKLSELCGDSLLSTYAYGRIYSHGDVLTRHRDRSACEISLSITLQKDEKNWPLWFQKFDGEEVAVNLNPGDAVMYLGCDVDHWRYEYEGQRQTQTFLHYVMANGKRAAEVFSGRPHFWGT